MDAYLASRDYQALAPATRLNTDKALTKVAHLMDRPVKRVTRGVLMGIMDDMKPGSAYVFGTRMRALFGFAAAREMVTANPMAGVKMPVSGEYRPLTTQEMDRLLSPEADPQVRMAVMLAYYTAQRISDVLKMRWDDITAQGAIHVRQKKTKLELYVPIHPKLKADLDVHRLLDSPTSEFIISMSDGSRYSTDSFRRKFARERKRLGLPGDVHFHGIRKTIASTLRTSGATDAEIKAMGVTMVEHYCKGADQYALAKGAIGRL